MFEIIMYENIMENKINLFHKTGALTLSCLYYFKILLFFAMSSIMIDHENQQVRKYETIFKHYGFNAQSSDTHCKYQRSTEIDDVINRDIRSHVKRRCETKTKVLERNESNKRPRHTKKIVQKTIKSSPTKSKMNKKVNLKTKYKRNQIKLISMFYLDKEKTT